MLNDDGTFPSPAERGDAAGARARELALRRADLDAGTPSTPDTARIAHQRAYDAHDRVVRALLAAAARHRRTATAHLRAAEIHERAVARGSGDAAAHSTAAREHRRAAIDHDIADAADRHRARGGG